MLICHAGGWQRIKSFSGQYLLFCMKEVTGKIIRSRDCDTHVLNICTENIDEWGSTFFLNNWWIHVQIGSTVYVCAALRSAGTRCFICPPLAIEFLLKGHSIEKCNVDHCDNHDVIYIWRYDYHIWKFNWGTRNGINLLLKSFDIIHWYYVLCNVFAHFWCSAGHNIFLTLLKSPLPAASRWFLALC